MNDQDLRSLLEQLHTEIERNEPLDEKERELLQHLELVSWLLIISARFRE